jgi:uncharacterized surface protein with fasciclin (FAS1) repeats
MKRQFLKYLFAAATFAALAACGGSDDPPAPAAPTKNIVELAAATPDLSTLVTAVTAAGLTSTLSGPGPFTVFAPTNAAFAKIPKAALDALIADKAGLTKVLTYHVVSGKVLKAGIPLGKDITTVQGATLTINVVGSDVITTDILATNGVVHLIDTVIMPPDAPAPAPTKNIVELAAGTPNLSTLVTAVTAAGLTTTLSGTGPFTVFAPTNDAFNKIPKATLDALLADKAALTKVLTYHVVGDKVLKAGIPFDKPIPTVQGGTITISAVAPDVVITDAKGGKSKIIATDILATNGVVHLIDTVIMPN